MSISSAPEILKTSFIFLAVCLVAAMPTDAKDLTLRLQGQATASDADALGLGEDFGTSAGAYLGLEYRLNERLGVELGVGWTELEQSARSDAFFLAFNTTANLTVKPVTVALDVHLTPNSKVDFYVAPRIGWAFFDDLEVRTEFDLSGFPGIPGFPTIPGFPLFPTQPTVPVIDLAVKDQFVYGLRLGLDVPFGDSAWSFASGVEVLGLDLEFDEFAPGPKLALDPISVGLGFGYRF